MHDRAQTQMNMCRSTHLGGSRCLKAWTHVVVVKCFRYRLLERATLETYLPFMGSGADEMGRQKRNYRRQLQSYSSLESTGKCFDGSDNHTFSEVNGLDQFACAQNG